MAFNNSTADLLFRITADTRAAQADIKRLASTIAAETSQAGRAGSSNLGALNSATNQLSASVSNLGLSFKDLVGANLASRAIQATASAALSGASALLDYSARLEQVKISFTTLLGSGEKANKLLKEIQEFAKTTPFEFEGLAKLSQKLVGAGVAANKVIPLIRDVGNAVSAVGGTQEDLAGVTRAITQIISLNRVQADELNQLSERNINGYKILASELGKTEAEVKKLVEGGKISADVFLAAFQRFSQIRFGDAMQKQSETFQGALSNIKDSILITASTAFNPLYERISRLAIDFSKEIEKQNGDFRKIGLVISEYIGIGLGQGVGLIAEAFGSYLSTRLGEIFTGKAFFDPIVSSFIKGFDSGLQGAADKIGLMFARFFGYAKPDPLQGVVTGRGDTEPLRALPDQPGVVYARSNEVSLLRKTTSDLDKILGGAKTSLTGLGGASNKASKAAERIATVLPKAGDGFKSYAQSAKQFGTANTIGNLERLSSAFKATTGKILGIGEIAIKGGGAFGRHKEHSGGTSADLRPIRNDGSGGAVNFRDLKNYDREATRKLVQIIKAQNPGAIVLFNDPQLIKEGLTRFSKRHDDHLHARNLGKEGSDVDLQKIEDERNKKAEEAAEKLARIEDDRIKRQESAQAVNLRTAVEGLNQEVELRASANRVILAEQETLLKNQEINEQGFARIRAALDDDLFALRKANKEKEFALLEAFNRAEEEDLEKQAKREVARAKPEDRAALEAKYLDELSALKRTNAEEESAIIIDLLKLDDEITLKRIQNQNDLAAATKQSVEERKRDELSLIEIRREVLRAEQDLIDFRNAQTRKTLENTIEFSRGKGQIAAIEALRAFDVREIEDKRARQIQALAEEEARRKEEAIKTIANKEVEEQAILELTKKYKILRDEVNSGASANTSTINQNAKLDTTAATPTGISGLGELAAGGLANLIGGDSKTALAAMQPIAEAVAGSFQALGQAVGESVKAFVLFGTAGGSFKKFAAELIASLAQMAAVQAVYELAQGFATLALAFFGVPQAAGKATAHFTAAAVFGGIAGVAAIAGRATAGNSFKKESGAGATSKPPGSRTDESTSAREQREKEERVIAEEERNQRNLATAEHNRAQVIRREFAITLAPGLIANEVGDNIKYRGDLHKIISDLANG